MKTYSSGRPYSHKLLNTKIMFQYDFCYIDTWSVSPLIPAWQAFDGACHYINIKITKNQIIPYLSNIIIKPRPLERSITIILLNLFFFVKINKKRGFINEEK